MVKLSAKTLLLVMTALTAVLAPSRSWAQEFGAGKVGNMRAPAGVRMVANLAYVAGGSREQQLDLFLPARPSARPLPLIIFLHGGGWYKGDRTDGRPLAFRMVAQGYAVACVSYRLSTQAIFPAQLEDAKAAVRWLRANARQYRLDADHIGAVGVSAGGYLAAMLGATNSTRQFDRGACLQQSSRVQAVCDFFGPAHLLRLYEWSVKRGTTQADEVAKLLGGDPQAMTEQARTASPAAILDAESPPFLIVHGANDTVVPPEQSLILFDAVGKQGVSVHLHLIHDAGHTGAAFVAPDINEMVETFFAGLLKPGAELVESGKAVITESDAP